MSCSDETIARQLSRVLHAKERRARLEADYKAAMEAWQHAGAELTAAEGQALELLKQEGGIVTYAGRSFRVANGHLVIDALAREIKTPPALEPGNQPLAA